MGARRRSMTMTEPDDSWHVVFGATGAIGRTVVTELLHAGRHVRAVSHGGQAPAGAQGVAAHASDPPRAAHPRAGAGAMYSDAGPHSTHQPARVPPLTP